MKKRRILIRTKISMSRLRIYKRSLKLRSAALFRVFKYSICSINICVFNVCIHIYIYYIEEIYKKYMWLCKKI